MNLRTISPLLASVERGDPIADGLPVRQAMRKTKGHWAIFEAAMTLPALSVKGETVREMSMSVPSLRRRTVW